MQMLHSIDIFLRSTSCFLVRVIELVLNEESDTCLADLLQRYRQNLLGSGIHAAASTTRTDLSNQLRINLAVTDRFHHSQMLQVVVSLEQSISCKELNDDAPYTPYVAGEIPAKLKDNLRGAVMPRGYDRRMVFVFKGSRAEIDQTYLTVKEHPSLSSGP